MSPTARQPEPWKDPAHYAIIPELCLTRAEREYLASHSWLYHDGPTPVESVWYRPGARLAPDALPSSWQARKGLAERMAKSNGTSLVAVFARLTHETGSAAVGTPWGQNVCPGCNAPIGPDDLACGTCRPDDDTDPDPDSLPADAMPWDLTGRALDRYRTGWYYRATAPGGALHFARYGYQHGHLDDYPMDEESTPVADAAESFLASLTR